MLTETGQGRRRVLYICSALFLIGMSFSYLCVKIQLLSCLLVLSSVIHCFGLLSLSASRIYIPVFCHLLQRVLTRHRPPMHDILLLIMHAVSLQCSMPIDCIHGLFCVSVFPSFLSFITACIWKLYLTATAPNANAYE